MSTKREQFEIVICHSKLCKLEVWRLHTMRFGYCDVVDVEHDWRESIFVGVAYHINDEITARCRIGEMRLNG